MRSPWCVGYEHGYDRIVNKNPYPEDTNEYKLYERAYRRGQDDKREEMKDNSDD